MAKKKSRAAAKPRKPAAKPKTKAKAFTVKSSAARKRPTIKKVRKGPPLKPRLLTVSGHYGPDSRLSFVVLASADAEPMGQALEKAGISARRSDGRKVDGRDASFLHLPESVDLQTVRKVLRRWPFPKTKKR